MDKSQNFNILEVNNLKTNKLDYSYSNNILNITTNNSKKIILNSNHSDNILNTQDYNMDINIKLTSQIIGTKHRILITNKQNSLRIYCKNANDKFKGSCKINNNSNIINNDILKNNLTKKIVNINDDICNDIIFIPESTLGLYNGGYIDLIYTGNANTNIPTGGEVGFWCISGNLIGNIYIPKNIITTATTNMILSIYILNKGEKKKIICATTKHPTTNEIYFNNVENNNISIFLNLNYNIQIIDVETTTVIYNSETYDSQNSNNLHNLKINKNLYTGASGDGFISLKNQDSSDSNRNTLAFINGFNQSTGETLNYNIKTVYNSTITDYNKLNIIQYKIEKSNLEIIGGFFNVIDINSYNNNNIDTVSLPNLIIGQYNIFTDTENNMGVDTNFKIY
tara:strand:+ start:579 stop:1766 length:1188 start_codon:yes stop_codon:yes gene_type:complete